MLRGDASSGEITSETLMSLWWQMKIKYLRLLHTPAVDSALEVLVCDLLMIQLLNSFNFHYGLR